MARLVNKQFNSPIGLYSQHNIQEVLDRESQVLSNGAIGINFKNPDVGKPDNLKNSAVLRMLEEEENRQRNGYGPGSDRILTPLRTWPPPEYDQKNQTRSTFKDVVTPGIKRVAWPPPHEAGQESPYIEQDSVQSQGGPHYPSQSAGLQQNNFSQSAHSNAPYQHQQQRTPLKLDVSQSGSSPLTSPLSNQSPHGYRSATPIKGWAPVHSPVATPSQPSWKPTNSQANYQPLQSPVAASTQPAWRQNNPTKFQAAHQPVSQQTFLGQQYSVAPQSHTPVQNQPSQQYQNPQQYSSSQQYQSPNQQYQSPGQVYQIPVQHYQSPTQHQTSTQQYSHSQQYQSSEQIYQSQPQYQSSQGQYQSPQVQGAPPQAQRQASRPVEPPPSLITLRPQAPVSQAPPPVFTSQPATATLRVKISPKNLRGDLKWPPDDVRRKMYEEAENVNNSNSFLSLQGGKHLRGDLKWPPEEVKVQAAEENRLRLELARGPVCRPRKVKKDYSEFFEQHALNSTYPGYKIPPGTQFYKAI